MEYEEASECFKRVLEYKRDNSSALNYLSLCCAYSNDFNKAITILEQGIFMDDKNEMLWLNLLKALFQVKNYSKLIMMAQEALTLFPENEAFPLILGVAYFNINEEDNAIEFFKKALDINNRSEKAWRYLCKGYNMKGVPFDYDEYKSNTEISWYFLAKQLMFEGLYDEAAEACNRALSLNPSFEGAFTLRRKIKNAYCFPKKHEEKDPPKRKKSPETDITKKQLNDRMKKIQQRVQRSDVVKEKTPEDSLDVRMEKIKKKLDKLKLDESDEYIESQNDLNAKSSEIEHVEKEKKENVGGKRSQENVVDSKKRSKGRQVKFEPRTFFCGKECDLQEVTFVVDGANLARHSDYHEESIGRVERIKILIETLESYGIPEYLVFFDRNLVYNIDDQKEYETLLNRENFIETRGGTQADFFILQYAKKEDAFIISNDMFRDFYEMYGKEWVVEKRIAFEFADDNLFFDKIAII